MLLVDAAGIILLANDAARSLLAGAVPGVPLADAAPAWLALAHRLATAAPVLPTAAPYPTTATPGFPTAAPGPATDAPGLPTSVPDLAEPAAARTATPPELSTTPPDLAGPARGPVGEGVFEAHPTADANGVLWWLMDVTERERVSEALRVERRRTAFLAEASNELLSSLNLDRCMEVTARLAARHLADAALVILPETGHRHPVAYCGPDGRVVREHLAVDPRQVPGLEEALRGFPPMPSRWIDPAAAPSWLAREGLGELGSVVVTPLPGHGVPAGALVLLRRAAHAGFSTGEEVFTRLFAARAGAAMSAARLYAEQASITEVLMRELLPPRTPRLDGVELAARYRPSGATELVGGDFYDLHPAAGPGRESLVVLGDVCGKGLEAAVLTGKIRDTLHALLPMADDHQRLLAMLNHVLLTGGRNTFVTLVLASVRRDGPQVRLRLTSAGHAPPVIVRAGGRVEEARTKGTLIGMLDDVTSTTDTVTLDPGDTCLLFTDGITEARGGPLGDELFGEQQLLEELEQCAGMPPEAIAERVQMLACEWAGGGAQDDMAVVAITAPLEPRPPGEGSPAR